MRPAKPDLIPIKRFLATIEQPLRERFGKRPVSRSHLPGIQRQIDLAWRDHYYWEPGPYLLAEGCSVAGLEAALHQGRLMFRWRTVFIPAARHRFGFSSGIPLGFFHGFDLYAEQHSSMASVYAVSESEVTPWHLHYQNVRPLPERNPSAIREALRRAQKVNAFWGTKWAVPPPYGRAALPVRQMANKKP